VSPERARYGKARTCAGTYPAPSGLIPCRVLPRALPWAGISRPVGAFLGSQGYRVLRREVVNVPEICGSVLFRSWRGWDYTLLSRRELLGTILIDGNGGFSSTVLEMLLYSQPGKLKVLPALPDSWPKGKADGMLARGGLTVDLQWDMQERVVKMNITSKTAQTLELYFPSSVKRSTVANAQCESSSRGSNYLNATVPAGKQVALRVEFE
jgi:hypothetical protein